MVDTYKMFDEHIKEERRKKAKRKANLQWEIRGKKKKPSLWDRTKKFAKDWEEGSKQRRKTELATLQKKTRIAQQKVKLARAEKQLERINRPPKVEFGAMGSGMWMDDVGINRKPKKKFY